MYEPGKQKVKIEKTEQISLDGAMLHDVSIAC